MTVVETDRIDMAESDDERILDEMFEALDRKPFSEGYRIEIVGGAVHMSPQRNTHWKIIRRIVRALEDALGLDVEVTSDVRIDFPGRLNGFCPDVAKMRAGAVPDSCGRWRHQSVEFVAEVISRETAANDYGPKKAAYAAAEVPVYLIADPYQGRCHVYTQPKGDDYVTETTVAFGGDIDLTRTSLGLTLTTADFPRD
ncbi:Uma2 family endonuclease [Streptomyces sp. SP18CS02]|uniref:Uma2 family endonuclease n=1 Tax=Streptomyces sp. SP18CS02 TaxID=3002531 RepID=UPI002E75AF94|nr:Uma2 family endonuclease [Streptomyces sp. SP18CS02]MEE1755701.1 Uma2 family endonuclease [Streptomyces sp. SP18CS02]